jgi:DNA transposition AAA+ family ATPase
MRSKFVYTENVTKFYDRLRDVQHRGAKEACIVVVDGAPGLGKTTCMSHFVTQTRSIYLRANQGWDYRFLIDVLLKEMDIMPPRTKTARYERLIEGLGERARASDQDGQTFSLVIDECDQVSSRREVMETIRDLSDIQFMPTILVGMGRLRDNLLRFPQIESRAPRKVRFAPASVEDARKVIEARCEVPIAEDLSNFMWKVSKGFNRELLEAIAHVERSGLRLDYGESGVTLADMAGQVVTYDRETGNAIKAPELI